jgi:hypothetical protein
MDLTDTIAPTSDQLDAVDLLGGPQTFTITGVSRGNAEQPVNITLAEFPRVWRPSKGMRRVLVACWGPDASQYVGRRVTLYCDPDVRFGGDKVGGTRISHLSHIDKPKAVPMLVSRGKSAVVTVQPLKDAPPAQAGPTAEDVAACTDVATLRGWWTAASKALRAQIEARVATLTAEPDDHEADMLALAAEAEADR